MEETRTRVAYSPRPRSGGAFILPGARPFHLPDLDALGDPFEVPLGSGEVRLAFLRRINNVDRKMVMVGEMRPDRGTASFSSVRAQFDIDLSRTIDPNDLGGAARAGVQAVNDFLKQYRHFVGAYWAQPVELADIAEFLIWRLFADGRKQGPAVYSKPAGGPLVGSGSQPLVDPRREAEIRSALAMGHEPPFAYEVFLLAKEHVHRHRYRNAVVDAATAFEVFLAGLLRSHLTEAGRSENQIEDRFRDARGQYLGVTALAKDVLRSELGVDFAGTAEYRHWKHNVRDVRNKVIHGSPMSLTREVAALAISDAQRAVTKLQALAPSS